MLQYLSKSRYIQVIYNNKKKKQNAYTAKLYLKIKRLM